jgi:DNA polymerase-3 subunit gamma/tau
MYAPTDQDRFKVYIIDEAHMLTREAWNALLKILEEPPPRVIFIFATTEPQRIQQAAPPILSRCQRFDFRRMNVAGIVDRLHQVLSREGIEIDDDALVPIARRADGGMRDALSLLDQVLSFAADRRVGAEDVRLVLGLVGEELYLELFEIVAERRHAEVFRFTERLLDEGYDLAEFYRGLADSVRTLLVVKLEGTAGAEVREDLSELYASRADRFSVGDLIRMLAQVAEFDTEGRFRKSSNPRILLEALLLRFAHLERTIEVEELLRAAAAGADLGGHSKALESTVSRVASSRRTGESDAGTLARPLAEHPPVELRVTGAVATEPRPAPTPATEIGPVGGGARETAGARVDVDQGRANVAGGEGPRRSPSPLAAFQHLLQQGTEVPAGLGVFLKAATLVEGEGPVLRLKMPAGPGFERLNSEQTARRQLEDALTDRLGRPVTLEVIEVNAMEGAGGQPPRRFTSEQVRSDRLERMGREEPLLGRAVQEWDLEWLD